jgi:AcrR family transcriptional regulator
MSVDPGTKEELLAAHDAFCRGFAERDPAAILRLFLESGDAMCVTSEDAVLRDKAELERFIERYIAGATTYSWEWHARRVGGHGTTAWLLAEGTETANDGTREVRNEYRMTLTFVRAGERWAIAQVHGSSPHRL